MHRPGSEVAQLRQRIADEYTAARLGLSGLKAGTSYHQFITARQERIGDLHAQLQTLVGDEAMALMNETVEALPDTPTRADVLAVLRQELGESVETAHLCASLVSMWETIDLLTDRFGIEQAQKIIRAPSSCEVRGVPPSEGEATDETLLPHQATPPMSDVPCPQRLPASGKEVVHVSHYDQAVH